MGMIGHWEWILIVVVLVLLFGGKKIPELAKGIGLGIKEFKKAKNEHYTDTDDEKEAKKLKESAEK